MMFTAKYLSVLQTLAYPAALAACGLIGNAYILGGQIKDVKDDLGGQIKDVKDDLGGQIKDVKGDMKEMKDDIRGLIRRQTEREVHDMAQCRS